MQALNERHFRHVVGYVSGRVQGVGFRYFIRQQARALGISGYARNLTDGRVEFRLQGEAAAVAKLLRHIRHGPSYSRVSELKFIDDDSTERMTGFVIG